MEMTSARLAQASQSPEQHAELARGALADFCTFARTRYGLDWTPETLPSQQPAELAGLLSESARKLDAAELSRRADACLAAGRDAASIAGWFERECMLSLGEFERERCAADPDGFVRERLKSFARHELEQFERWVLLQIYDEAWKNNLHAIEQLKDAIGYRGIAQKDPRIEFKRGAAETFNEMLEQVRERTSDILLKGRIQPQVRAAPRPAAAPAALPADPAPTADQQAQIEQAELAGSGGAPAKKELSEKAMKVVGRNEPCPCGSGKKYKACHGAKA
jgi:hypothetical protein